MQDPPATPSDTFLLLPLKCLYKSNVRIQERPQPGDSRPVLSPSQRTLSRQIIRNWEPWKTNIRKSNNHRTLQQLAFHKQQYIGVTRVQDLDPSPCTDNVPKSIKRRTTDDRCSVSQWDREIHDQGTRRRKTITLCLRFLPPSYKPPNREPEKPLILFDTSANDPQKYHRK